jgi:methylphosphotriester-DNA--protein-cysteine methyltransferase
MWAHEDLSNQQLKTLIRKKVVTLGGNKKLKIFGTLSCSSGKRMKKQNRVFFASENEAIQNGFRPCGNCMREAYAKWKI